MRSFGLVDTGGLLALLDRNDPWHELCVAAFREMRLPLLTSQAVLTEFFHLAVGNNADLEAAWKLVRCGAFQLGELSWTDLRLVNSLMSRYADRPMDFADATLVLLAERESLTKILTVDHADFQTYRIKGRGRFQIVPQPIRYT